MRLAIIVLVLALVGGLIWASPDALALESAQMSLTFYAFWAVLMGGAIAMAFRRPRREVLLFGAGFIAVVLVLVGLYSFREEARALAYRVAGELVPGLVVESVEGEVTLRKARDGHFYAAVKINGRDARLMVDTGASNIVLDARTAERVGVPIAELAFNTPVATANGRTMAARVVIPSVGIGEIRLERVQALVARPGDLDTSLLGMSFLGRLQGFEVSGTRMVLKQ